ncbi:MAG: hypothetical protein JO079_04285 [Frankiaceae bacterium]|nr:hypothetical protein [Frankiaceae bacterium]MBV9369034.1 hypothetical protein [Frankiales bacterium]
MIETDALSAMIADAEQVHVSAAKPAMIDLTLPRPRTEIRIPESASVLLLDYELYV